MPIRGSQRRNSGLVMTVLKYRHDHQDGKHLLRDHAKVVADIEHDHGELQQGEKEQRFGLVAAMLAVVVMGFASSQSGWAGPVLIAWYSEKMPSSRC